jgi:hypothetical protein
MQIFVIHRTASRAAANKFFQLLARQYSLELEPFFLKRSYGPDWKKQAESAIVASEAVVLFDPDGCGESENTKWEIGRAKELGKPSIPFFASGDNSDSIGLLRSAYDFSSEFDECFSKSSKDRTELLDLYKTMLETSEQLIQRRQVTSGFFITIIGAILAGLSYVFDKKESIEVFLWISLPGLLLAALICRSWHSLLVNYGKLNAAKFKVIGRLEAAIGVRMFDAEWIALGKGVRKQKYQSFTASEANVPKVLMFFFGFSALVALAYLVLPMLVEFFWAELPIRIPSSLIFG